MAGELSYAATAFCPRSAARLLATGAAVMCGQASAGLRE